MKQKTIITTIIAFVLLVAVIAAGVNAIFTVTYVRATFRTYTERGAAAAESLKEELNGYINRSSVFLNLDDVRATVEADPRFEVVSVAKEYPETVVVEVVERREAFAVAAEDGTYTVLDEEGWALGSSQTAEGYILLEGFALTVQDGRAGGENFDLLLQAYNAMRELLGEVRANVLSVAYQSPADWTLFRIQMREGAEIVLLNPADRTGEMAAAATQCYLDMTDADRILQTITVTLTTEGEIAVDVGNVP